MGASCSSSVGAEVDTGKGGSASAANADQGGGKDVKSHIIKQIKAEDDKMPQEAQSLAIGKNLMSVLHDPICIEYFAIHLANEHSSENLDFYESVDHFHHEWDIDHVNACKNIANKILQLYCGVNAPLAVNLPSKIRIKTENSIMEGNIKRDTFDSAANEIYQVMNRDSFARFKVSNLWASYVSHPDRHPDGAPPPAVKRLADCYTGRRNSESLMQFIGQQTIEQVIDHEEGLDSLRKFLSVDSDDVGRGTLALCESFKGFKEYVLGLGIPRGEDMYEIEDNIKFLIEKHFGGSTTTVLPENVIEAFSKVQITLDDENHTVKQMCLIFNEMEKLALEHLTKDSFDRFLNSALYIKYRMAIVKSDTSIQTNSSFSRALSQA
jgi:hypothetical protein